MSTLNTSQRLWTVMEHPYTIQYEMLHSINTAFEDFELWEFGIHCKLFDEEHNLLSEAEVTHISPDKAFVTSLVDTMLKHKVFPVHLIDVVSDELMKSLEYCS